MEARPGLQIAPDNALFVETPLSNFEAGSNYKDVQDPAVRVFEAQLDGAFADLDGALDYFRRKLA